MHLMMLDLPSSTSTYRSEVELASLDFYDIDEDVDAIKPIVINSLNKNELSRADNLCGQNY
jgi:hypothetical protein